MALDVAAANRDREVFGDDAESYRIPRMLPSRPFGLVFGSGPHTCLGMALSIGQQSESEASGGTSGLLVLILDALYRAGMRLDPLSPPLRNPWTAQDRYISFPVLLDPMGSVELAKTSP
jgi:hypothetical protein